MLCPNCQTENREGAKFCDSCGARLPRTCSNCGTVNRPEAKFCDNCGQQLDTHVQSSAPQEKTSALEDPRSALNKFIPEELLDKIESARAAGTMEGERRVVTMLFCDVKGSTEAAEQLDPEQWAEIINGAFEYMIRPVYRYEGTVARLMGDAILAFFGAPIAHEDDPRRAVLAGLDIINGIQDYRAHVQEQWGFDFNVRVGINTGLVVVGAVGSDLRMEYTAMGDAINLAARMEQTARPGSVQVAEDTYQLVASYFEFEDLGGIRVGGKSEPVQAYRVLGRKGAPGWSGGIKGMDTPLIGRQEERQTLKRAISQLSKGVGGIVCLIGEAGLGKSRLIYNLQSSVNKGQPDIQWYDTLSLSHETNQPYGLFRRLIRRLVGVTPGGPTRVLRDRLKGLENEIPSLESDTVRRVFESLYGLSSESGEPPLEGEAFKGLLFNVMSSLWRHRAERGEVVMVFDDMHWSDRASVELLGHLFPLTEKLPLLIIGAMRPDRKAPAWKAMSEAEIEYPHRFTEISLKPLDSEESGKLVDGLMDLFDLPRDFRSRILEKTEGNPLFVEEVVRSLIDQGLVIQDERGDHWQVTAEVRDIDIPGNLQTLLTARIDRLQERDRRILQIASVIGRSFYFQVLAQVVDGREDLDQHLINLQRNELIQEEERVPELRYSFRHTLTQEAAYKTILHKQRRNFHLRVGEAIETVFSDQKDEMAATLAHHFLEAGESERALEYYLLAGDVAFRLFAVDGAVNHYTEALELARQVGAHDPLEHLYIQRGRALELDSQFERALANYEEMQALARKNDDQALLLSSLVQQGQIRCNANALFDPQQGEDLSERALELAREQEDQEAEAKILWNLLNLYRWSNRIPQAIEFGERSLELSHTLGIREQTAFTLNDLAHCYGPIGRLDRAKQVLEEARSLWREMGNLPMLADSLASAVMYESVFGGDYGRAIEFSDEAYQISQSINNVWGQSYSRMMLGNVYWEQGHLQRAIAVMQESIEFSIKAGFIVPQILTRAYLGRLYAEMGFCDKGLDLNRQALDVAEGEIPVFRSFAMGNRAHILIMDDQLGEAETIVEAAKGDPNYQAMDLFAISVRVAEAELHLSMGNYEDALEVTHPLLDALEKIGARMYMPEVLLTRGRALLADGQVDKSDQCLRFARSEAEAQGSRRWLWQILDALAQIADQREEHQEARALREKTRSLVGFISDHIPAGSLRESFQARPDVHRVLKSGGEKGI